MENLSKQKCEACEKGAPKVSSAQAQELMADMPRWNLKVHDGVEKLIREYEFRNFRQALAFTNRIGDLAEQENHHPTLVTEWGKVTVYWWTHKIKGLHMNDFVMAAKSDEAAKSMTDNE